MPERKILLSWAKLSQLLYTVELAFKEEEIREITLVKPKGLVIYLRRS